jgi:hypothetical protein
MEVRGHFHPPFIYPWRKKKNGGPLERMMGGPGTGFECGREE